MRNISLEWQHSRKIAPFFLSFFRSTFLCLFILILHLLLLIQLLTNCVCSVSIDLNSNHWALLKLILFKLFYFVLHCFSRKYHYSWLHILLLYVTFLMLGVKVKFPKTELWSGRQSSTHFKATSLPQTICLPMSTCGGSQRSSHIIFLLHRLVCSVLCWKRSQIQG